VTRSTFVRTAVVAAIAVAVLSGTTEAQAAPSTLYVSNTHTGSWACRHTPIDTVQEGVDAVAPRGTVIVCAGTYPESVAITKRLTLRGLPGAVIESDSVDVRIQAEHVTVTGLTLTGPSTAITVELSYATVAGNVITDTAGPGIVVRGVHNGVFRNNRIVGTLNGIFMEDPGTPVQSNSIIGNVITDSRGPGIWMVNQTTAGIIDNVIQGNVLARSQGDFAAGISMVVNTGDGGVIRGNRIVGNKASDNGHAGIEILVPFDNADVSGNAIAVNNIGTNNVQRAEPGDAFTTGVYVDSAAPMSILIAGNCIHDDEVGIFTAGDVTTTERHNVYRNVAQQSVHVAAFIPI
jgi:nitrous oxidase accessory protein NosD